MDLQINWVSVFATARERSVQFWNREKTTILLSLAFHTAFPILFILLASTNYVADPTAFLFVWIAYGSAIAICVLSAFRKSKPGSISSKLFKNLGILLTMFAPGWAVFLLVDYISLFTTLPLIPEGGTDCAICLVGLFGAVVGVPALLVGIFLYWIGAKLSKIRVPIGL